MPVIVPGSKVLVTGANGFAAIHIVDALLKKGYSVRATTKAESEETHLKKIFGKYGGKLEFVIVPDIAKVSPIQHLEVGHWVNGMAPYSRTMFSTMLLMDSMLFCTQPLPSITVPKTQKVRSAKKLRRSVVEAHLRLTACKQNSSVPLSMEPSAF